MPFEKKVMENEPKTTVRMQYRGHFKGTQKIVNLPIPLIANSQKLEKTLVFELAATSRGPAFCEVDIEWAGTLLDVGGLWSLAEKVTPEVYAQMAAAKEATALRMKKFIEENDMVEL